MEHRMPFSFSSFVHRINFLDDGEIWHGFKGRFRTETALPDFVFRGTYHYRGFSIAVFLHIDYDADASEGEVINYAQTVLMMEYNAFWEGRK